MELDHLPDDPEEGGYVLVVGSAGIDIKGKPAADYLPEVTNLGRVRNSIGGAARNIAENLARLEVPTILLSAVGVDAEGSRVLRESEAVGINCSYVRQVPGACTASHMALLRPDGQLHLAVSDIEVSAYIDSDYIQQHELLFLNAEIVVVDATLSDDALDTLFEITTHYNRRVCVDPTSPQLASKLRPYIQHAYLVVPNAAETVPLCGVPVVLDSPEERTDASVAARELLKMGADVAAVTLGAHGLTYAHSSGGGFIRAANVEVIDPTGAGDAFTAAVIFGLLNGVPVDEAMRLGATAAALTLSTRETVSSKLSQEQLYEELVI